MTTWDRRDKPLAIEFKNFAKIVGKLDLTGVRPSPAEMAIVIPDEWAKPRGDFSRFGLVQSEATPYASISDSDAVPGQPPAECQCRQPMVDQFGIERFRSRPPRRHEIGFPPGI